MRLIEATGELQADRGDVWALVAEPYHLPDWWPALHRRQADRTGSAENARWQVVRSRLARLPAASRREKG